jgi:hypothetical protein
MLRILSRRSRAVSPAWLVLGLALAGCGGGEEVTSQSIRAARRLWDRARILDYDVEWTSSGLNKAHYLVAVRDGRVRSVEAVQPDGRRLELHPPEPRFYGVDGLFTVLSDELAQLQTSNPFGQAKGTKVVMRFTPDPRLGYPRSYHRNVLGTPQVLAIEVLRLTPHPSPAGPVPP